MTELALFAAGGRGWDTDGGDLGETDGSEGSGGLGTVPAERSVEKTYVALSELHVLSTIAP